MSFEDALNELEKIVRQIEDGRGKLDEAISAYERGVALKRHCESKLKEAQVEDRTDHRRRQRHRDDWVRRVSKC